MKLVVEQAGRGISGAVVFSGKLSPFYSSGLAEQRGCSESGWKRGKRLGSPTRRRRKTELADYGSVRRALGDRHDTRAIIG